MTVKLLLFLIGLARVTALYPIATNDKTKRVPHTDSFALLKLDDFIFS